MKKTTLFLPLLLAAAAAFTACSDDNEITQPTDQPTAEEAADLAQTNKYNALNSIIRPLAGLDKLPDNWDTAIFTPTEGTVTDEANPEVRSVIATDAEGALQYFQAILPETGLDGNTWHDDNVGTLTFTTVGTDKCFATIDVDLKQMPGLKQIRFVPENVIPANSKFSGTPYYNMGDVVRDKKGFYWICVRPSGGPLKKDKSYFVSFNRFLFEAKNVNQDIYLCEPKGKEGLLTKTKTKSTTSGIWSYASNITEKRIAIAAAHTFATIAKSEIFSAHNPNLDLSPLYEVLKEKNIDMQKLANCTMDGHCTVYMAYGNCESSNTKYVQEKKIQPILCLDLQTDRQEVIYTHNYLDSEQKYWLPLSLTQAHSQHINMPTDSWDGENFGYSTPFSILHYAIGQNGNGLDFSNTKFYNYSIVNPHTLTLVTTQMSIIDKGQADKDLEVVVKSPFSTYEGNDFYYATLPTRHYYDQSHTLKTGPKIEKTPKE